MRIAYVITRADSVGGATIHVRDMARAMRERGHQPMVFVGGRGPVTAQFDAASVAFRELRHLRRPINPIRDWLALQELTRKLRAFAPDLVSTHTAKAGWIGRVAAHRLRLPVLYTPHGLPIGGRFSPGAGALFTLAERAALPWTTGVICVSESERRLALEKRVARPDQLHVVHNGVRDVPAEQRARPGGAPVRICSIARLERPKDHATLLAALATLTGTEWTLDLVGDGPLEGAMRGLAGKLGIAGRVRFLGYVPDPAATLAAAHLFVLASWSEAFPRSVLEAMRAGLPVVATDVGGVGEAVTHRASGLRVPPGDVPAMATAIGELLLVPELRRQFGERARQTYDDRFRLERTVEKTLAVYRAIMGS